MKDEEARENKQPIIMPQEDVLTTNTYPLDTTVSAKEVKNDPIKPFSSENDPKNINLSRKSTLKRTASTLDLSFSIPPLKKRPTKEHPIELKKNVSYAGLSGVHFFVNIAPFSSQPSRPLNPLGTPEDKGPKSQP